ncbi:MAG: sugar phosphate isomerase/epimerase family protein [Planctomycetota bacterium]|jgi:D-psicose/D-tagatose/L-ribulose 3-epimerase
MKTGINLLLWTPVVTEEHFGIIEKLKAAGYDGVEVPLFSGEVDDYKRIGQALKDNGLGCTTCTVMPDEEHNPISADPNHRKGGVEYLKWVLDCCEALGAEVLCGPYYHPLGTFTGVPPTPEEKERGAEVHREVAGYAEKAGVGLAIECLNRFECYFLNTIDDGAAYAKQVGHPNFGVMYDSFHANIEEKDPIGCIGRNLDLIRHVHVSENDRGTPGKGHVPFGDIFKALRAGGYDQWLTIEAFGRSLPELAATTCVWRDLSASPEECYGDGLKMIKETWEASA